MAGQAWCPVYNRDAVMTPTLYDTEAEKALLGGILLDPESINEVIDELTTQDFYDGRNGTIYGAMLSLLEQRVPIDLLSLRDDLGQSARMVEAGGETYLAMVSQTMPCSPSLKTYARIVSDKSIRRRLATALERLNREVRLGVGTLQELREKVSADVLEALEARDTSGPSSMKAVCHEMFIAMREASERATPTVGYTTGLADLDQFIGGFRGGRLYFVGGRPGMAKTSIATHFAREIATLGLPVLIHSMEMPRVDLGFQMLSAMTGIDGQMIEGGRFSGQEQARVGRDIGVLANLPIYIDHRGARTLLDMKAAARRIKAKHGKLGAVVCDYLQLMDGSGENRHQQVGANSRGLKALAKELDCPVIALSQLSRKVEERADKRPMLSDLKESGDIEADADVVMFLYRHFYYTKEPEDAGVAEIIIAKQRRGPCGTVKVHFNEPSTRFRDLVAAF